MAQKLRTYTLDEVIEESIGKRGTPAREQFEYNLQMEILGDLIKKARKDRKLSQEELGRLIGVQKAQISRLENHTGNVTLSTILKVFNALKASVKFSVELDGERLSLVS
ncbi:MAG: helix-turn-helix transcriptional regulator [Bacteroidia bacterium]|nr:helix-turn-helix transcriptional regulator [Bacteroidia bacterium]